MAIRNPVFWWSLTVALAGFLFGFDTVVISGADLALQELWPYGKVFHGFVVMGSALWGTVVGAILGGLPTDRWGRRQTLLWIGVLYTVGALGSALATDPWVFAAFRFLGGLGVGASTIAAPAYISEIAPPRERGRLVALYQFNIVLGILLAFCSNYLLREVGPEPWRWMLGVQMAPALAYALLVLGIPESPRWLLTLGKKPEQARKVLAQVVPAEELAATLEQLAAPDQPNRGRGESIFSPQYQRPLLLAFLMAFFNQFSGINAFLYYAPRIFAEAGLGASTALLSSIGIGLTNLVFTLVGLSLIDRFGRKQLMYLGSYGYILSLSMVAAAFVWRWEGLVVPIFLFLFIAAHAIGQGTVIWVFISEIFPNHLRASGQAFGSSTHWVLAAIIPSLTPFLFAKIGPGAVFAIFALMMIGQLAFVAFLMPETRGLALEDLDEQLRT